jgi:hypothetical protein
MLHIKDITCYRDKKKNKKKNKNKKSKKHFFSLLKRHFSLLNQKTVFCSKLLYNIKCKNLIKVYLILNIINMSHF